MEKFYGDNLETYGLPLPAAIEAADRGRKLAMNNMLHDKAARDRVELEFGLAYCKRRYPELYEELDRRTRGKVGFLDRVRGWFDA